MSDQQQPHVQDLEKQHAEVLTIEQAEEAQGGKFALELDNAVSHEIVSPRDPASGLSTGR